MDFFDRRFSGWSQPSDWTPVDYDELDRLLSNVHSFGEEAGGVRDERALSLDRDRLDDVEEAWIPVDSAAGPAILIFENSD